MTGLHEFLRASAERNPAHPVFVRRDQTCTYGDLDRASGRFAAGLQGIGIQKGDRVALALDGDIDFLIATYGISKAGGVVIPLCPDTRTGPLVNSLAHSGAAAVILDAANVVYLGGQAPNLPALRAVVHRGAVKTEESFRFVPFETLLAANVELHGAGTTLDDLVSITYTSGTTGRPKGVMLSHRNLTSNLRSIVQYLALTAADRVAGILPFYYVYGNSVLHTHVLAGATVVHAGSMAFPTQVLKTIETQGCTGLSGVPATFARLLSLDNLSQYNLDSLRYFTQAGAGMPPALTQRLSDAFPRVRLFVMYGQTEASARLSYVPPEDLVRKLGSAGKAIPGVQLRIVDADGKEVAPGETGEVVARGDNIMVGYWNDPHETARVLRDGALHTGDLAWMDDEGFLFIVGRESEMIKSGAHRISPREIEEAVERTPGVRECAVVGVPDEMMGQLIAAYVVPQEGQEVDRQTVLRACLADLPRFKLPEQVFFVPELPRTPSGKVQRAELVRMYAEAKAKIPPRPSAP